MYNFFEMIDYYGQSIELNIDSKTKAKTPIGGVFTIFTIGFVIGCTWTIGKDIFYHEEPFTSMEDRLYEHRPRLNLDRNSFPIAFTLQDINQVNWEIPRYFRFEIFGSTLFNKNSTEYRTYYNYTKCTYDNFPNYSKELFDSSGMANYLCVNNQNFTIEGYWDEELISQLFIRLRLCNNQTDGGNCAPFSEISNFVSQQPIAWNIYFRNTILNTKNSYPLSKYMLNLYKSVRLSSYKSFRIFIKPQTFHSDSGLIFENLHEYSCLSYDSGAVDESDPKLVSVIDIVLNVAEHENIYKRSYIKVQTIIANVGGLLKAAIFILNIFSFYFSKSKINEKIANRIFELRENYFAPRKEKKNSESKVHFIKVSDNKNFKPFEKVSDQSNQNLENEKNNMFVISKNNDNIIKNREKFKTHKNFDISFFLVLKYLICFYNCRRTNNISDRYIKLYKILEILIYRKLDVRNFIRQGEELEILKKSLLDETQLKIFRLIYKQPVIEDSENFHEDNLIILEANEKLSIIERLLAFQNKDSNIGTVDKRLFNQMKENVKLELLKMNEI
jgi:hypothetical protein